MGEAGATVVCTGRSSNVMPIRSDYDRAETIEQTAELVTSVGGVGIAVAPCSPIGGDDPTAPTGFAASESPRYVGRAIAALAADPDRTRWNQRSVTSAQLAHTFGFTDIDTRPDSWAAHCE